MTACGYLPASSSKAGSRELSSPCHVQVLCVWPWSITDLQKIMHITQACFCFSLRRYTRGQGLLMTWLGHGLLRLKTSLAIEIPPSRLCLLFPPPPSVSHQSLLDILHISFCLFFTKSLVKQRSRILPL